MVSAETIPFEIHFSQSMNCDQITNTIQINSTTANGDVPQLDTTSVQCNNLNDTGTDQSQWCGAVDTTFIYSAKLVNVSDGIHQISVNNVTNANGTASTGVSRLLNFDMRLLILDSRVSTISCYVLVRMTIQWFSLVPQITVRACCR